MTTVNFKYQEEYVNYESLVDGAYFVYHDCRNVVHQKISKDQYTAILSDGDFYLHNVKSADPEFFKKLIEVKVEMSVTIPRSK